MLLAGSLAVLLAAVSPAAAPAAEPWAPAYGLDDSCVTLQAFAGSTTLGHLERRSNGYGFTGSAAAAEPFRFDATQLGRYTVRDSTGAYAYQSVIGYVLAGSSYGDRADWTVSSAAGRYRLVSTATGQQAGSFLGRLGAGSATLVVTPATGCSAVPDVATGVTGTAAAGVDPAGRLNGWIDAHAHVTAGEAFGGDLHCGDAFAPGGVAVALAGCPSHATLGIGALLEALIGGTDPIRSGEDGWPTFGDWPQHNSLLHEQAYFRGIERSWRAGQRVLNTLLVANRVICELYPSRDTGCDEMTQIRAQAAYLTSMQDYVDAQSGGPGKGWFRLAATPAQVRQIAAQGKLAVTIGVENSELFGCREVKDVPRCTTADIDAGLDEMQALGVSGLYPVHKFDNAFGGTRFDEGVTGAALNIGNLVSTGHWWTATSCTGPSDNTQPLVSDDIAKLLGLGGLNLPAGTIAPVYPSGPICNTRGLTALGTYLINQMMARGMIIHIDHMGVRTATAVLDLAERAGYPGVTSVHSWSDRALVDRLLGLGGFAAGYAFGAPGYLDEWRANRALPNGARITGYGVGSDVNGLGPQAPPGPAATPLTYPFTAPNGTTVARHVMGTRTFDLNTDGVAQYGLYADWVTDLVRRAGPDGPVLRQQLMSGAEAYTVMWERARE
jgi:microsomal dipeptidase-like Zn-dependent dipeptidase